MSGKLKSFLFFIIPALFLFGLAFWINHSPPSADNSEIASSNVSSPKSQSSTDKLTSVSTFDDTGMYNLLDGYRIESGLNSLTRNPSLDAAARLHAADMKSRGYYSHTTPDGVTAYTRINNAEGGSVYGAENEDNICSDATPSTELTRYMESVEHNDIMLDPRMREVGVGYVGSDPGQCNGYLVIDFAGV